MGPTIPLPPPPPMLQSVRSVEVTNSDEGRDGFQITFNVGKGAENLNPLDYSLIDNPLLKPFNMVTIGVTIGVIPHVLINGVITHIQLNPSNEPGQTTLTVTGEDVSVMMDMEEKSETHPNQPDNIIANKIILSYAKYGLTPLVMPPPTLDVPIMLDRVPSQQGTDLSYLMELAAKHDFTFYVEPMPPPPGLSKAYWGPLNLVGTPQKALSVNMGPDTNVKSISFQYNALKPSIIVGSIRDRTTNMKIPIITFGSLRPPLSSLPAMLTNLPNVKTKQFRASGLNAIQAYAKAQAETDKSTDVLTATGEVDVFRYGDVLRARKLVGVRGVGFKHGGLYYVKSVTHTLEVGNYKQAFTLVREGYGSSTPLVRP